VVLDDAVSLLSQIADPEKAKAFYSCIEIDTYAKDNINGEEWIQQVTGFLARIAAEMPNAKDQRAEGSAASPC
jgi:hypothetical protein